MSMLLTPPQPVTRMPGPSALNPEPSGMPPLESLESGTRVRCWVTGAALAAAMAGTLTLGATQPAFAVPLEAGTVSPQLHGVQLPKPEQARPETPGPRTSTAAGVTQLRADTGLTWDQLGRLFGVSRRAVHLWASGKQMNARNIELLSALEKLASKAPGGNPQERRAWLFSPDREGVTPLEQFMATHRRNSQQAGSGTGYTPAGLLGMNVSDD